MKRLSGGTSTYEPQIILADDQAVMVYGGISAQREGKMPDIDQVNLCLFYEDGK